MNKSRRNKLSLASHGQSLQAALGLLHPSSKLKEPLNGLNKLVIDEVKQHHNLLEIVGNADGDGSW